MRPDLSARFVNTPARFVIVAAVFGSLLLAVLPAAAQPPGVDHRRGQAAIDHLGSRLPAVAAQHNMAAARLRELFQTDPYIAVDEADNLLFIDEFVPEEAGGATGGAAAAGSAAITLADTFFLHSLPGATKKIYLDFDGHTTTGTPWNSSYGSSIVSAPFSLDAAPEFSAADLERIQYIWQRVAEDFIPYGVDVTTQDPGVEALRKSGATDEVWGQRVVISPTNWYNTGAGGVAYIGSFSWNTDTPCFAFTAQLGGGNEKYTAEAVTHEAGHTVGLYHDGVPGSGYYSGHNGWAPIMGVGYYQELVQWSKGEYQGANNTEDDLTVMTGYGFGVRPDDHADTARGATPLVVTSSTSVSGSGIIEQPTDTDYFSFVTGAGTITLNVTGAVRSANLDVKAELYDSTGALVAGSGPSTSLNASISQYLAAGTYTLVIDGVGKGDLVDGYSDYGSLGQYFIGGTIVTPGVTSAPVAAAAATPTSGNAPLIVTFSSSGSADPDGGTIVSYLWGFGDTPEGSSTANPVHTYHNAGVYTAVLTVTDDEGQTGTASVVVTVAVPPAPPAAPSGLTATAASPTQINLAWVDGSSDETGFAIEQSTAGGSFTQIATVGTNVASYISAGLSAGTRYDYRVRAYKADVYSGYSNTASATPPSGAALHVGDLDGTPTLSKKNWSAKVTITVQGASEDPVPGAVVTGSWSTGGSGSCTTGTTGTVGTCTITRNNIAGSASSTTFTVSAVTKSGYTYNATANHDPDGSSNGTSVVIRK